MLYFQNKTSIDLQSKVHANPAPILFGESEARLKRKKLKNRASLASRFQGRFCAIHRRIRQNFQTKTICIAFLRGKRDCFQSTLRPK